jgi:hypothetical protein
LCSEKLIDNDLKLKMIVRNKKLSRNLNIFSNGSLLTTFVDNSMKTNSTITFFEKDFKTFEKSFKNKLSKNTDAPNSLINYRKKLFK